MFEVSIENMQQEIELYGEEDGTSGITYDGITTSPTHKFQSLTEDTALSAMEKIDYLEHSIRRAESKIESIDRALEALNEREKQVIESKYFKSKQWWQVASEVGYSERTCRNVRRIAIGKIAVGIHGEIAVLLPHQNE